MSNKISSSVLKMTALSMALLSASCCCCKTEQKRPQFVKVEATKGAPSTQYRRQGNVYTPVQPAAKPCKPARKVRVMPVYRTNETLNFPIQTGQPLPGNYWAPYNNDGTSFPIQSKNPLPGNMNGCFWGYSHRRCY